MNSTKDIKTGANGGGVREKAVIRKEIERLLEGFKEWRMEKDRVKEKTAQANYCLVRNFYELKKVVWEQEKDLFHKWCLQDTKAQYQRRSVMRKFWQWAEEQGKRAPGINFAVNQKRTIVSVSLESMLLEFRAWRKINEGKAQKTVQENCINVRQFYALQQPLWEKEEEAFQAWIGECPVPSDRRYQKIFALRKFWEWAELAGKRAPGKNFAKGYKTKKVERIPKVPPREDVQTLIKIMNEIVAETQVNKKASWAKKWKTLRNLGVIVLMAFTGIRAKELLHLLPENVDVKEMQVIIPSTVSKTRVERVCYLPSNDYVAQLIKNVKCMHKFLVEQGVFTKQSPLFASLGRGSMHENSGNPLGRQEIWRWARKIYQKHGFPLKGVHDFRRYFATDYIIGCYERDKNPDIQKLCEMLGHTSLETTQLYVDKVRALVARRKTTDYEPGETALMLIEKKIETKNPKKKITPPKVLLTEPVIF